MDTRQAHQDVHQDTPPGAPGEWVTIAKAARRLGVSPDAIRRRIRRGTMRARRGTAEHGGPPPYLVWLGTDDNVIPFPDGAPSAPGRRQDSRQAHQDTRQERQEGHQDAARTSALAQTRAAEMAAYSEQLLAPYLRRVEELSRENGRLEERCATLQGQLAEATSKNGQAHEGAAPEIPARRRWWRWLWG